MRKKWKEIKEKVKELALSNLFVIISILWVMGIFMQLIDAFRNDNYTLFRDYGEIALTIFGFTLIGGIFENRKTYPEIVKRLFNSSLSFLTTAISFFFIYSLSSFLSKDVPSMDTFQIAMIVIPFSIAMLIGFFGIIFGLLDLYKILIEYKKKTFDKN